MNANRRALWVILVCGIVTTSTLEGTASAQSALYAAWNESVTDENGVVRHEGLSHLYAINPSDGSTNEIGPINFRNVHSMDVHHRTGGLYGVGHRPSDGQLVLLRIDPVSGAGTEIGPITPDTGAVTNRDAYNIAFHPANPLYGTFGNRNLYQVDRTTGAWTFILRGLNEGASPPLAMDFSSDARLYYTDGEGFLWNVDPDGFAPAGEAILCEELGDCAAPAGGHILSSMSVKPGTNTVYAFVLPYGGSQKQLVRIDDPATGVMHFIGYAHDGFSALAWSVDNTQPGSNVDVNLGLVSVIFSTVTQPGITTLAMGSVGPAPPPGFRHGNPTTYYDLRTTAAYS